ncbi:RNAse P Rpr2/Rpp21/SNM1 subunit domain-containing protein [Trametes polyzona]|nr:RNAse P Rpr2/Rpp21/SNM1 subunit domain-containing protein [Trametes polyzona]
MAKKNKDQEPVANVQSAVNRDIIQRINFLYQASTYLNSVSQASAAPSSSGHAPFQKSQTSKAKRKQNIRHPRNAAELSRSYIGTLRTVGQKTMVRMDPTLKRTLCQKCDTVLLPGTTSSVRVNAMRSHGKAVVYTCLTCKAIRRIPAPPAQDPGTPLGSGVAAASTSAAPPSGEQPDQTDRKMHVDTEPEGSSVVPSSRRKYRRKVVPRPPPLFERKGHVVFRGNERLVEEEPTA